MKIDGKFAIISFVTVLVMVFGGLAFVYKMTEFYMTITDEDVSGLSGATRPGGLAREGHLAVVDLCRLLGGSTVGL